jgi:hypothetical protein
LGAALLLAACAACDAGPLAVEEPDLESGSLCQLPQELLGGSAGALADLSALRPALAHAASLMTPSLPVGPARDQLQRSLTLLLAQGFGTVADTDCAQVSSAWTSLAQIPRTPESLPDRDGIALVLALAARALATLR